MFFAIVISLWCAYLISKDGFLAVNVIFWLKISTSFIIYFFVKQYKKNEFYYYRNLGFSITVLWIITFGIDFIILILFLKQALAIQ